MLKALGHPVRLEIVRILSDSGEANCVAFTRHAGLAQSTVSEHLRVLQRGRADQAMRSRRAVRILHQQGGAGLARGGRSREQYVVVSSTKPIALEAKDKYPLRVEWNSSLTAAETGDYTVGVRFQAGFARVWWMENLLPRDGPAPRTGEMQRFGTFTLRQGKKVSFRVVYSQPSAGPIRAQLIWRKYDPRPSPEAVAAAKAADVVIAVLGISSELEGEEMPVSVEGFKGGDRTSIDLPKPEQALLEAVTATGKPVVLVLANGSALAVNWAAKHANAIC